LLDPVGGKVAVDGDRRKKGRWPKNRPGLGSGHAARTAVLFIVNSHFRSMTWIKMRSSVEDLPASCIILILIAIVILIRLKQDHNWELD